MISEVYAGFHVICWLHFVREGGRERKREKREGKGILKGYGDGGRKGDIGKGSGKKGEIERVNWEGKRNRRKGRGAEKEKGRKR